MRAQPAWFWVTDGVIAAGFAAAGQLGLHFHDGSGEIGHASLAVSASVVALIALRWCFGGQPHLLRCGSWHWPSPCRGSSST
jgi:hypothetical protein